MVTIIPDWYYNFYGDDRLLRDNYQLMKRFVLYHQRTNLNADHTTDKCTYGDWVDTASMGANTRNAGATSAPLMGTAYLYHNARIVQRAAAILGHDEDERYFGDLANRIYEGFNQRFFDQASGTYESATQCSAVLPLAFGLVPDEQRRRVIDHLVNDIMLTHQGHTSVGLIGMQWQMQVLTEVGRPDVAWSIATRTERPSWGYMIAHGATTSWERWDTDTQDGGMNGESQKILSGNFEAWCYQSLGGINYDPQQPGFRHIILKPQWVGDLKWAKASHDSVYGRISSEWEIADNQWRWKVIIPPNTTATAHLPAKEIQWVRESGEGLERAPSVDILDNRPGSIVLKLGSGTFEFTTPL